MKIGWPMGSSVWPIIHVCSAHKPFSILITFCRIWLTYTFCNK